MFIKHQIFIPKYYIGRRFDFALAELMPDYSRMKISKSLRTGYAFTGGSVIKAKDKIKSEVLVELSVEHNKKQDWQAEDIPLDIIYEDDDIIVINKPAGLIVHPGAGNQSGTLANGLLHYDSRLFRLDRAGIVHRLDKGTSGLLVVARSLKAQKKLVTALAKHTVRRSYKAIVSGHIIAGDVIDKAIARDKKNRLRQIVQACGKHARTHYQVATHFKNHTELDIRLETGRTHQIRAHFSYLGHPLVGDKLYTYRPHPVKNINSSLALTLKKFSRPALHANSLAFMHPVSHKEMSWQTQIPEDMRLLLAMLKANEKT